MDRTRRKELIQSYKMALPPMGIFAIRHRPTGRMLIEQSANLAGSMNRHRLELQLGTHRNRALLHDWRAHGEEAFAFEILQRVQERAEPDYDYTAELQRHLAFWRNEIPPGSTASYL